MRQRDRSTAGYTLLEMLIVIAIIGLISSLVFPALQQFIHRNKILGIARSTGMLMREARYEAIKRGVPCIVRADGVSGEVVAYADVDGDLTYNPDPLATAFRSTDYEIRRYALPGGLAFDGPLAQPPVFGFTDLPGLPWNGAVFETDGSIRVLGGIRFADPRGNYLEVRVEPAATARVWVSKWDGANWLAQAEGGKTWEWL